MHLCTFDKTTNTTAASCVLQTDMSPSQLIPRKQRNVVFNVFISQIIILALSHTRPSRSLLTHTALSITQTNHEQIS